jgi:hypothetical protein
MEVVMSTVAQELEALWEHNRAIFPAPSRKIQIQRAGSRFKSRYAGTPNFCFGLTPEEATKKLKTTNGSVRHTPRAETEEEQ